MVAYWPVTFSDSANVADNSPNSNTGLYFNGAAFEETIIPGIYYRSGEGTETALGSGGGGGGGGSSGLWSPSGSDVYYDLGDVGIGTSTPRNALEIEISASDTVIGQTRDQMGISIDNVDATANNFASIAFSSDGILTGLMGARMTDHANNYGDLVFATRGGGGWGERMTIEEDGNVGIGTTTPGTNRLEVAGGPIKATGGLIIETRTSDPVSPAVGQIWLRTDI